jgi:2-keto-3-deoxy-L-fuconate dehydrogenase
VDQTETEFDGLVAIVTGGASGIGAATAAMLRDRGATVVVFDRTPIDDSVVCATGGIEANDDDEWHRVYDVNVLGLVRLTRATLPWLRKSPSASIVNTGSIVSDTGLVNRALYSATKGAVHSLTRAMAADLLADKVRVNAVSPGTASTPWVDRLLAEADDPEAARIALIARQPIGRLVTPDEIANAIAYLASPRSGSTTGTVLAVDGGLHSIRVF